MTAVQFREAYSQHKDALYRFAWRMTGSPVAAEDLVQDCFLFVLRTPSAYNPERGTPGGFLFGVVRNLALKWLRAERAFDDLDDAMVTYTPPGPEGRERTELIAHAIAALPALQRETLILAEYEDLPLEEIARIVGAELAAVKSRLHRARQNLKRMLEPLLAPKGVVYGSHG